MIPIVIDTNIIFTALYNPNGLEQKILYFSIDTEAIQLFAPDIFWEEIKRNLVLKLNYTPKSIETLLAQFDIIQVPAVEYNIKLTEANDLISHSNDIPFIATCLFLNCPIWSENEKRFRHFLDSKRIVWFNSERFIEFLRNKGFNINSDI